MEDKSVALLATWDYPLIAVAKQAARSNGVKLIVESAIDPGINCCGVGFSQGEIPAQNANGLGFIMDGQNIVSGDNPAEELAAKQTDNQIRPSSVN